MNSVHGNVPSTTTTPLLHPLPKRPRPNTALTESFSVSESRERSTASSWSDAEPVVAAAGLDPPETFEEHQRQSHYSENDNNDDDSESSNSAGSEGGHDLNCTQIVDLLDDSSDDDDDGKYESMIIQKDPVDEHCVDDDDDAPLIQLRRSKPLDSNDDKNEHLNYHQGAETSEALLVDFSEDEPLINLRHQQQSHPAPAPDDTGITRYNNGTNSTSSSNDMSTCFVCGSSLTHITTGMKGRLNHIKRCSKKHGVSARDMRFNDDSELFVNNDSNNDNAVAALTSTVATNNPYKRTSTWHGDASDNLKVSATTSKTSLNPAAPSVNNILMAGARNAAKLAKIKAAAPPPPTNNKRGWGGGNRRPRVDYSQRACPAYKKIPGTDFVCDGFQYAKACMSKNYFLTHFHSDHYGGISKTWNAGTIYCSLATANLVNQQLGVDRKYLHPLPMLTPSVIESRGKPVTVTLLDANHCPGAVMFLFAAGKKRILHVGDFRWNREFMMTQAPLRPYARGDCLLDELFLDTTYCDPKYTLPTQTQAIEETIKVAQQEVVRAKQNKHRILMLFGAYTIGKERIYLTVAERLGMKVYVDKRRYRILSALGWPQSKLSRLTTRPEETIIWVVPLGHINMKNMGLYSSIRTRALSRDFDRVVGFRPTGWSLSSKGSGLVKSSTKGSLTVHAVPYSEHSSFPELVDCLDCLKPRIIVPTVSVSKSQQQIDLLVKALKAKRTDDSSV